MRFGLLVDVGGCFSNGFGVCLSDGFRIDLGWGNFERKLGAYLVNRLGFENCHCRSKEKLVRIGV